MIRDARERQGIRLEKVSSDLHIRVTYLQAIENGRSEILPSPVQGRGFVRMFAHYLKLDPESVLAIWDSPLPNETPSTGSEDAPGSSPNAPKRPGTIWKKLRKKPDESQRPVPSAEPVSLAQSIYDQIGEQLRERRELLGLTREDAEAYTNVRADYLERLEEGKFSELESSVQARGILNSYANFLNLDTEAVMIQFANALQLQSAARIFPTKNVKKTPQVRKAGRLSRFFTPDLFIGATVILAVFFLAIYSLITIPAYREKEALKETEVQAYVQLAQTGIVAATATPPPPTAIPTAEALNSGALIDENLPEPESFVGVSDLDGAEDVEPLLTDTPTLAPLDGAIQILIESNQRAFLKVTSDGTVVFVGRTEPAMTYSFSGNQVVEVETGNASALRIQYNNRNLGSLGGYAEVKKIAFSEGYIQTSTPALSPTPTATIEPTATAPSNASTPTATITPYIP